MNAPIAQSYKMYSPVAIFQTLLVASLKTLACIFIFQATAYAGPIGATINVNSIEDRVDSNPGDGVCADSKGKCTLRAAIMETNALAGSDTIIVPDGLYVISIPGADEDAAATGDLDITDDLTVQGSGSKTTIIDGGGLDGVIHLPPTLSNVTISGITVQNGNNIGGGGIANTGVDDIVLSNHLDLNEVMVTNNVSTFGGGIINGWGGSINISNSTVSGNQAAYGGGIYTRDSGNFSITNSTISDNVASTGGGAIDVWWYANVDIDHSTLVNNSALSGGGILIEIGSVSASHSIIALNSGGDCSTWVSSAAGYNLDSDGSCTDKSTDLTDASPSIGVLQDSGGPTFTNALLPGNPAIDHIPIEDCAVSLDQRNTPRPQGTGCDIGAFERTGDDVTPQPYGIRQTITFASLPDVPVDTKPFTVSATASSGLPVSFTASGQCTVSGNKITITGAGTCTVTASQAGDASYAAASSVSQTFNIDVELTVAGRAYKDVIQVAVRSDSYFDAGSINVSSAVFRRMEISSWGDGRMVTSSWADGAPWTSYGWKDIDHDGDQDRIFSFDASRAGFGCSYGKWTEGEGALRVKVGGAWFYEVINISIAPCGQTSVWGPWQ